MPVSYTFTPGVNPAIDAYGKQTKTKILQADFGDGYSQRAAAGLNSVARELTLEFRAVSVETADAIEAFMEARKGYEAFYYTLPDEDTARKWKAPDWSRSAAGPLRNVSVKLEEVFDL